MTSSSLDVLLIEPYFAGSHRSWAEGYVRHSRHRVRTITHAGSFWRWRMRGAALTLAREVELDSTRRGRPDVVLVSDMVNVASLVGLARRALHGVPVALYLHENQLLYPPAPPRGRRPNRRDTSDPEEPALVNWLSMAAADRVFVNSAFHRDALFDELPRLLKRAPDHPHLDLLDEVEARTMVLPVGVELADLLAAVRQDVAALEGRPPLILWNQRWEHDKDPEAFFAALHTLAGRGVPFRVALAGENVRVDPQEFDRARRQLGDRVVHVGFLDRDAYRQLLLQADVVASTAHHEFFGVAMVEAIAAGAVPLLPDRLSYPELIPDRYHRSVLYEGPLHRRLEPVLRDLEAARHAVGGLRGEMAQFSWEQLAPRYDEALEGLAARS